MKEYGGYLPFELRKGCEWYTGESVIALNSARYGIVYAVRDAGYRKIHIPFYMCDTVKDALDKYGIAYELYHFDEKFEPAGLNVRDREAVLYPNYYGLCSADKCARILQTYKNVIFDNTQAFFAPPVKGAYNVYSCRKFIGVSDGAYVVKEGIVRQSLEADISYGRMTYLFKCMEEGTNAAYPDSLDLEQTLTDSPMRSMSALTHMLMQNADYEMIITARKENYRKLDQLLGKANGYAPVLKEECIPMIYPFLVEDEELRHRLVSEYHIYIPQWWKVLLEREGMTSFEERMIRYLLPLPVDQRYNGTDMEAMASCIMRAVK
ncbi:MAG: hypothetical protein J6Y57_04955 [Lachnospiraceae bacterium]|nr:hypothetical protein [Lachnospiraceae bacterium]